MEYIERMQNVSVLGAAGKMGSGILLLAAFEMAELKLSPQGRGRTFVLNAIDVSDEALAGLLVYLRAQALKAAEKNLVHIRKLYAARQDLIDNADIVRQYISDVLDVVRPATSLESAARSHVIFEGVNESEELKIKLFRRIEECNSLSPWYFTNTSSIPIGVLNEKAALDGRIIGFHFYNPPAVQKLVEVIQAAGTKPELTEFAQAYGKRLRKTLVHSHDTAGFIGNGHFMRDVLHGIAELEALQKEASFAAALYSVNRVTQDFLIRPMGIFQLMDYVGLDVCQFILKVMQTYLPGEKLHSALIDSLLAQGVKGGQNPDGSQKDGLFKYEKGRPVACWDPARKTWLNLTDIAPESDKALGELPASHQPWKKMISLPNREVFLRSYFGELKNMPGRGAMLALSYARRSREIGLQLVSDGVAATPEDVNTVLLTGFFHAYGPINDFPG
jgi:3-hydroxyacyl-CoA dehydrogenase